MNRSKDKDTGEKSMSKVGSYTKLNKRAALKGYNPVTKEVISRLIEIVGEKMS